MKIGAYAIERDYSHYVAYASKTVLAVVSTATKGPVGVATVCTSSQELVNRFGPLNTKCYGLYAGQYFLSQASMMYFVRAAGKSATESVVTIPGLSAPASEDDDPIELPNALKIKARYVGTYADGYAIVVADAKEAGKYKLTIKNKAGRALEIIDNLSIADMTPEYESENIIFSELDSSAASLTLGTYKLEGGNDGIDDICAADYITASKALESELVNMSIFAVPGISDPAVVVSMLSLAETRGDCLYLVDPPEGLTRDGVVDWHNGAGAYADHTAFNSSYGALYYDWVTIYDSVNKVKVSVPPSVVVAATMAYSDRVSEVWYAPAGLNRGIVRGVLDSNTKLSKADTEYLYSDSNHINSLYDDPQVGLVVWGQKTLQRANTSLDRVNVRRLMNYLKKIVVAACNYLTYEPNDRITWNAFDMLIRPVLEGIKMKRGIYDFQIVKGHAIVTDQDIDNSRMPCMILVRPTKAAEEIPIYFVLTSTGADFNEVLEANGVVNE